MVLTDGERVLYQVEVYTGNKNGSSTKAGVHLVLVGDIGRTKQLPLAKSKNHKIKFKKGQVGSKRLMLIICSCHTNKNIGETYCLCNRTYFL